MSDDNNYVVDHVDVTLRKKENDEILKTFTLSSGGAGYDNGLFQLLDSSRIFCTFFNTKINAKLEIQKRDDNNGINVKIANDTFRAFFRVNDGAYIYPTELEIDPYCENTALLDLSKYVSDLKIGDTIEVWATEENAPSGYQNIMKYDNGQRNYWVTATYKITSYKDFEVVGAYSGKVFCEDDDGYMSSLAPDNIQKYCYVNPHSTASDSILFSINIKDPNGYNVRIRKVSYDDLAEKIEEKPTSGVKFKVNNEVTEPTDENGYVTIAENSITKDNVNNSDKYEISEIDLGDNTGIVKLKNSITVYVKKGLNDEKDAYILKSVSLDEKDNTTDQEVELEDGRTVRVTARIEGNTVTVTIPNKNMLGAYYVTIKKVNNDEQDKAINRSNI